MMVRRRTNSQQRRPWAWSILALALAAVVLAGAGCGDEEERKASYLVSAKDYAEAKACLAQLKSVGSALTMFASTHDGKFPASLDELIESGQISGELIRCPHRKGGRYVYVAGQDQNMPPENVLVYEAEAVHRGDCNLLRLGGTPEAVTPEQLQADLAETLSQLEE